MLLRRARGLTARHVDGSDKAGEPRAQGRSAPGRDRAQVPGGRGFGTRGARPGACPLRVSGLVLYRVPSHPAAALTCLKFWSCLKPLRICALHSCF